MFWSFCPGPKPCVPHWIPFLQLSSQVVAKIGRTEHLSCLMTFISYSYYKTQNLNLYFLLIFISYSYFKIQHLNSYFLLIFIFHIHIHSHIWKYTILIYLSCLAADRGWEDERYIWSLLRTFYQTERAFWWRGSSTEQVNIKYFENLQGLFF